MAQGSRAKLLPRHGAKRNPDGLADQASAVPSTSVQGRHEDAGALAVAPRLRSPLTTVPTSTETFRRSAVRRDPPMQTRDRRLHAASFFSLHDEFTMLSRWKAVILRWLATAIFVWLAFGQEKVGLAAGWLSSDA